MEFWIIYIVSLLLSLALSIYRYSKTKGDRVDGQELHSCCFCAVIPVLNTLMAFSLTINSFVLYVVEYYKHKEN